MSHFSDLPAAHVEALHELWGGSARLVLGFSSPDDQVGLMSDSASAADYADLSAAAAAVAPADGGGGKYATSPHILIHLAVTSEFTDCYPVFASDFTRDRMLVKLAAEGRQKVLAFLAASESKPGFGSLRGHVFERLALSALFSQHRNWPLVTLGNVSTQLSIDISERPSFIFSIAEELRDHWDREPAAVGRHRNLHWPSWDAVTLDAEAKTVALWQMTVSPPTAHGIKGVGLLRAAPLVPAGFTVHFIFVVLNRAGMPLPGTRVAITGEAPQWAEDMKQFLLVLQLDDASVTCALRDASEAASPAAPGVGQTAGRKRRRPEGESSGDAAAEGGRPD